jgi:hypothetical protein
VVGNNAFQSAAPEDVAAILASPMLRACDIDFWPNIDYLASKSPTSLRIIVDADANNDNVWLIDKATATVFGALGICGIIPSPGHNLAQFETSHSPMIRKATSMSPKRSPGAGCRSSYRSDEDKPSNRVSPASSGQGASSRPLSQVSSCSLGCSARPSAPSQQMV